MLSERKIEERNIRKNRILDGALRVFNEVGIEKTTMDEIAIESGFGKATLYYYFSSKDEDANKSKKIKWVDYKYSC